MSLSGAALGSFGRRRKRGLGDLLRGEWWIDSVGNTTFADGDVGDFNHEALAFEAALGVDDDALQGDQWLPQAFVTAIENRDFTSPEFVEFLLEHGANMEFVEWCRKGDCDAREYALEHMGWIRVKGDNFEVWRLTDDVLKSIQGSDIWENVEGDADIEGGEVPDDSVLIEELATRNHWTVPVAVLFDASGVRDLMTKLRRAGKGLSGRSRKLRYQVQVWTERGGMIPVFAAGIKEAREKAASAPTWITPDGPNARVHARTGRVVRVVVLDLDTGEAVS